MVNEKSIQNLKPFGSDKLSVEEQKAMQSKGGKQCAINKRKRKTMQQTLKMMLDSKLSEGSSLSEMLKDMGIDDDDLTNQTAIMFSLVQGAIAGDTKAAKLLIDLSGNNTQFNEQMKQRKAEFKQKAEMQQKEYELHKQKIEQDDF